MPGTEIPYKEGYVKKRTGRMRAWTSRYFVLTDTTLSYKHKQDSTTIRSSSELVPGCMVTDVVEEKKKKLFSFWVVWPHDKSDKCETDIVVGDDSDDDGPAAAVGDDEIIDEDDKATKNLKQFVENKVRDQRRQREMVEEQVEKHEAHDKSVSRGVAVGGAVVAGGILISV
jgi:hypothetical protein